MQQVWNPALYQQQYGFVWHHGSSLLDLLAPQMGECILDLGCGLGQLTEEMAQRGAIVQGIDADPGMVAQARQTYPHLQFTLADARNFWVDEPLDAVFSNAVLHWIHPPDAVIACIDRALKPGGRFVAEFGGRGNIQAIVTALETVRAGIGLPPANPWYFPSLGDYTHRLEQEGLEVTDATLFDRPTPLEGGAIGMANWIRMFGQSFLVGLAPEQQDWVMGQVEEQLRPDLYRDGSWVADYRRLRVVAFKR
ncbi:class I SAM-dependent methyltransferase [Leptolyngbya sp. 'hensonii']|uniref:class I SAM-dependent methyltransferase n=1 Tax=Leptolyngbya sp. 'hensonii' TaxID=1922337 RepID=UPI000A589871|nr:class I SAM-dependent methyltransferase [Leptolyngbya sp. 'hensonii']